MEIRNIAIIAHVDHGKTTLVDNLLKQGGVFRANEAVNERVMDSMDQERERGITIQAKNASFSYKGTKVNIVDTPGHSDFGGEVERILSMVDGCCLLVDASEGPLPQTRFVLKKALTQNLKVMVVINKIDRPDARIQEVENEIFDLFIDLEANDEQMNYETVYTIARRGLAFKKPPEDLAAISDMQPDLTVLYDTVLRVVPPAAAKVDAPLQMLISNLGHSDFVGRLVIGRLHNGVIKTGQNILVMGRNSQKTVRVQDVMVFEGLKQVKVDQALAGDIAVVAGVEDIEIGDTLASPEKPVALPRIEVDPPAVRMSFHVNTSPYAGKEGKPLLSREMGERLQRETQRNVSIRVEPTNEPDVFTVFGRGELQLAVLIESLRREGCELAVGKTRAVLKDIDGAVHEPIEHSVIDCPEEHYGVVSEMLHKRCGQLVNIKNNGSGRIRMEFDVPSRGLIGFRSNFLTATRGEGVINTIFKGYEPYKGDMPERQNGGLISDRLGETVTYALFHLQPRGRMFIGPNVAVYEGMIVGEHSRENDLWINVCKEKKLTNMRASGTDEMMQLAPPINMSMEKALEWIRDDELVEVTPKSIRIRKRDLRQK